MMNALKSKSNVKFRFRLKFPHTCFGHFFLKPCQYVTIDEKACKALWFISIKFAQSNLQKWPKTLGKGRHEWNKAC